MEEDVDCGGVCFDSASLYVSKTLASTWQFFVEAIKGISRFDMIYCGSLWKADADGRIRTGRYKENTQVIYVFAG